ncbi:MAG: hypothetical protein QW390_04240 [Candidatus Bathyarchaeia archaeon]
MVYVPYVVAKEWMMARWEEARKHNPSLPRPTPQEIKIQWLKWLDYYPLSTLELEKFKTIFSPEDRNKILFRVAGEYKASPTRDRRQPAEHPIAGEPD